MKNSEPESAENTTEKTEPKPKKARRNYQDDRQRIGEIDRLAIIEAKVWFVLCVVTSVLAFSFGLLTVTRFVPANPDPVAMLITASTSMIDTLFILQMRIANKRLDNIRDKLKEGK